MISLAVDGLYRARSTVEIQDEWIRNLRAKRPELDQQKLQRTASLMALAVDDALIDDYQFLIPTLPQTCQVLRNAIDLI